MREMCSDTFKISVQRGEKRWSAPFTVGSAGVWGGDERERERRWGHILEGGAIRRTLVWDSNCVRK